MMTDLEADLEALAGRLRASSVAIRSRGGRGSGSGIVWARDGVVVTNAHVAQSRTVDIELADGRHCSGIVRRRDEQRDLAEIHIDAGDLHAAEYRSPHDLRAGEMLVAFGHPLGVPNVLTTGIAFGPHRSGSDRFVRADLHLAPGNSGGALADVRGRVVGVNSMFAGGLALAVPSDDVRRFMGELVPVERLGVRLAPVQLPDRHGAYAVLGTEPGSAAERSGLLPGDILLTRAPGTLASAKSVAVLRGGIPLTLPIDRRDGGIAAAA